MLGGGYVMNMTRDADDPYFHELSKTHESDTIWDKIRET